MGFAPKLRRHRNTTTLKPIQGTIIGDIDGPTALIGPRGSVGALDGSWRFEWGAGADDRWHVAHDEVAVRQSRVDDTPVFLTSMRVPSGDLECRVASATNGMSRWLTIEFTNASPGGVALGAVVRVAPPSGRSRRDASRLSVDRSGIELGGTPILAAQRRAGGVALGVSNASDGGSRTDPWTSVKASPESSEGTIDIAESGGFAAMVFPLPHKASLSMRIAVEGDLSGRDSGPASIASGWRAITAGAATAEVPDTQMVEAWRRVVPDLVIAAGSTDPLHAAEVVPWLDLAGLHDEADRARARIIVAAEDGRLRGRAAAAAIAALASRELRAGQPSGLSDLVDLLVASAGDSIDHHTLTAAAVALRSTASGPAGELLRMAASLPDAEPHQPNSAVARGAAATIGRLIGPVTTDAVDLLPSVPAEWFGQPVDLRGLQTHVGQVSFSIRWHGSRPALLWEREGGPTEASITCSGLDRGWSSTQRSGEALLQKPHTAG